MFSRNRVLIGIIGIVLATPLMADSCGNAGGTPAGGGGTAANNSSPGGSAKPSGPVAVGTVMTASNGDAITVTAFGLAPATGNEFETAAPGKECDQVTLAITNGSSAEWTDPPSEVGIVDASGQKYTAPAMNWPPGSNGAETYAKPLWPSSARFR